MMNPANDNGLLPNWPFGLSRTMAASYVGVSPSLFDAMVGDNRMPPARRANNRKLWPRPEIEAAVLRLPVDGGGMAVQADDWEFAA